MELVFTADGAQICGAKSAIQTAVGIKIMDKKALDPITKKPMFFAEYDSNNNPTVLKNYQTFQNHAIAEIILHIERQRFW